MAVAWSFMVHGQRSAKYEQLMQRQTENIPPVDVCTPEKVPPKGNPAR
jgi:hypothetical protein